MGAWVGPDDKSRYYKLLAGTKMGFLPPNPTPDQVVVNLAVRAIQHELIYHGFTGHATGGQFGPKTRDSVKAFQASRKLGIDGIVGPLTGKALWQRRIAEQEVTKGLRSGDLCGLVSWESLNDPGATGWKNPRDCGLAQINLDIHTSVSQVEAFDPAFSIPWAADNIRGHFDNLTACADDFELRMDCALASHNSPADGKFWCANGHPPDDDGQIAKYVQSIKDAC